MRGSASELHFLQLDMSELHKYPDAMHDMAYNKRLFRVPCGS